MIIVNELYFVTKDEWSLFPLPFRKAYYKISSTSSLHKPKSAKSVQSFYSATHFLSFPWNYDLHYHIGGTDTTNLHNHFFCISAEKTHLAPPLCGLSSIWTEKVCASYTWVLTSSSVTLPAWLDGKSLSWGSHSLTGMLLWVGLTWFLSPLLVD